MTTQIPGVVSGLLFTAPPQRTYEAVNPQALLNSLQSGASSTSEIQFLDPPTRAVVSGALRTAAADADGVPMDYNPAQLRVVINPGDSGGQGEIEMSAAEFRQQIINQQHPTTQPPAQSPQPVWSQPVQPAQPSMDSLMAAVALLTAQTQQVPQVAQAQARPQYASTDECQLDFLTTIPARPQRRVVFDLGLGGVHKKRYHHAMFAGNLLSLCYDTRYDDEDFVPPTTQVPGQDEVPIGVEVEALAARYTCLVHPEINTQLGCVRIVNLLVIDAQAIDA